MSLSNVSSYSSPSYQNQQNSTANKKGNKNDADNGEKDATKVENNASSFSTQDMIVTAYDEYDMPSGSSMAKPEEKEEPAPKREPIQIEIPQNVSLPIKILFICFISPWLFFVSILIRIYNLMNNPFSKHKEANEKKNALYYAIQGKRKIDSRFVQLKPIFDWSNPIQSLKSMYTRVRTSVFPSTKSIPQLLIKGFKQGFVIFSNAMIYADYQVHKDLHFVFKSLFYTGRSFGSLFHKARSTLSSIKRYSRTRAPSRVQTK